MIFFELIPAFYTRMIRARMLFEISFYFEVSQFNS